MKMYRIFAVLLAVMLCLSGCGNVSDVPQPIQPLPSLEQPTEQPTAPKAPEVPEEPTKQETPAATDVPAVPEASDAPETAEPPAEEPSVVPDIQTSATPEGETDKYQTAPVPEGKPEPVEPQDNNIGEQTYSCTLSISCRTILDNMNKLDSDKHELIPADGWVLPETTVTFYEGESVFDVLIRTCRENKIHMEYVDTPLYNSAYIEGIGNLYEFDCGNEAGWMYCVNDWFPNYGCSRYALADGDVIQWVYTCDLGRDVGDNSMR